MLNNINHTVKARGGETSRVSLNSRRIKDPKASPSEDTQRAGKTQMVLEEDFLAEATDDTEPYPGDNDEGGSISLSRASSISELTEEGSEIRPIKRAKSDQSASKEPSAITRASSPLSVDTDGVTSDRDQSRRRPKVRTARYRQNGTSATPPKVTATISVQPPSTPAGPSLETTATIREFNERSTSQQTHSPQEPYVASPHNVFRPPPSAALAVFDRPPSPSFYEALQAAGQPAKISPNLQPNQALPNPFSSPNGSTGPKIKLSLSGLKAATAPSAPAPGDGPSPIPPRHPRTSISVPQRANSLVSTDTSPYAIGRIQKGKGKAKLNAAMATETVQNNDYCAACLGIGSFLCCDGCPRSFHFMCLDPPLTKDELPDEDKWYCKACRAARRPKTFRSPHTGIHAELLQYLDDRNPSEFQLPEDIRTFFAGIQTKPDGSYGAAVEARPVKFDRAGFPEGRDSYKLKSKGDVVLCYKCKGSAAPVGPGTAQGLSLGRKIVTCDYCPLSWHLDCLEPPAAIMPTSQRKWMCPNHAAQVMPKKRLLRHGVEVIHVTQPGQTNNGLVEIIDAEAEKRRLAYENMFINGKRYKVPERIIHLDFWAKLGIKGAKGNTGHEHPDAGTMDVDDAEFDRSGSGQYTMETVFGGGSPLSSAPSSYHPSPHLAVQKLPAVGKVPETGSLYSSVDAAQILLSLSHGGQGSPLPLKPVTNGKSVGDGTHDLPADAPNSNGDAANATIARDFALKPHINVTPTTLVQDGSSDASSHNNQVTAAKSGDATASHSPVPLVPLDGTATPISARKIRLKIVGPEVNGHGIPLPTSEAGKDSSSPPWEGV